MRVPSADIRRRLTDLNNMLILLTLVMHRRKDEIMDEVSLNLRVPIWIS